jgi:hypothetical protein
MKLRKHKYHAVNINAMQSAILYLKPHENLISWQYIRDYEPIYDQLFSLAL